MVINSELIPVGLDEIGALLSDHDGHCVGMTAGYCGGDGSVDHPQTLDAVHPESRVHDRVGVRPRTHLARAHLREKNTLNIPISNSFYNVAVRKTSLSNILIKTKISHYLQYLSLLYSIIFKEFKIYVTISLSRLRNKLYSHMLFPVFYNFQIVFCIYF